MEYTLSTRKSVAEDMLYQNGKLYEICEIYNNRNAKWLYWNTSETHYNVFTAGDGFLSVGDNVVFLGYMKNFLKLLLKNGTIGYAYQATDMVLKPL